MRLTDKLWTGTPSAGPIHPYSHRFDGDMIAVFAVALTHRFGRFDGGGLGHTQKIERQFTFSFDVFHPLSPIFLRRKCTSNLFIEGILPLERRDLTTSLPNITVLVWLF
jgi:hypothetical protein